VKFGLELIDARFEWCEPHSRRLRVRVVVRKEISEIGSVVLQGHATVELTVKTRQCNECAAENSTGGGEPWRCVVQLRQRVSHKRVGAFSSLSHFL
jgi:nonsense-mediated mRNA decay protein 3